MSRNAIILTAGLSCIVLVMWMRSGEEKTSTPQSPGENARPLSASGPSLPQRQPPRSLLDRFEPRRRLDEQARPEPDDEAGTEGEILMKDRLDRHPGAMADRPPAAQGRRQAALETNPVQQESRRIVGAVRQGQLSRKAPEPEDVAQVEQPPLRAPLATDEGDDENSLEHLRDVALRDPDPDERADAISDLDLDDPAAMQVLIQALDDPDAEVRLAALGELSTSVDEPPAGVLASVLHDPDPEVRLEVVRMLADSEQPYAQELLRSALSDVDEDVRDEAADGLEVD